MLMQRENNTQITALLQCLLFYLKMFLENHVGKKLNTVRSFSCCYENRQHFMCCLNKFDLR